MYSRREITQNVAASGSRQIKRELIIRLGYYEF